MSLRVDEKEREIKASHGYMPSRHNYLPDDFPAFSTLFKDKTLDLEVEAGCGMGTFLEERMKMRPDINYLGLETGRSRSRLCKQIATEKGFDNVEIFNIDARIVIEKCIPSNRVSIFHVYFPDPWPKQKHMRRRLVDRDFLTEVYRCLKKDGRLEIATDHEAYFQFVKRNNQKADLSWSQFTESINQKIFCPHIRTDFERMWIKENRTLFYMEFIK
jgi:tRNA (guanine-N(7)-)-methyltransferase